MRGKLLLLIILVSLIIGASALTRGHEWGDDFAWYILQAKSIWTGTTNEFIQQSAFTNSESTTYVGPLAYPWGYPLILIPSYAIRGIHPLALKLPALVFYAGFLVCFYFLMRARLSQTESLLLVAVFAFNPLLLRFLDQILSDIPFLFFSTLSLWLVTRKDKYNIQESILIGVCIFLVTFLRATGILLLGCFLLVEFYKVVNHRNDWNRVKQIVFDSFVVCVSFVLLWILNSVLFPGGGESYISQYAGLSLEKIIHSAGAYINVYSLFFGEAAGWRYLYYVLTIFFLIGLWNLWRQELFFVLFFGFWMVVHIAYPYWQGPRYIFPLLPIFIYFTFQGMKFLIQKLPERQTQMGTRALYGFWALMAVIFLFTSGRNAYLNLQHDRAINGPFDPYSQEVYQYITDKTPTNSVVIFFKPRVMVLMTDHPTIMSTECDRMLKGDYLVLSRKVGPNQQITPEEIGACHLPLNEVLKNNRFVVYQIQK